MKVLYYDASECTECKSKNIGFDEKKAEFYCRDCGYVFMDNLPVIEAEYGKPERILVNKTEKKIAVVIKGILKSPTEKKMAPFYMEIKKLHLPKYVEAEALTLARKAVEKKLTMSFSKIELLSAIVYYLCKREAIPILIKDLEKTYRVNGKRIHRTLKLLKKELNFSKTEENISTYIIRISSDIGHNGVLATRAIKISEKLDISHPLLRAGVSVWLASKELNIKIEKKKLSKAAGVSYAALRRWTKEINRD